MKKTMFTFFVTLVFLSTGAFANTLVTFKLNNGHAGGAVDDEYIFLYPGQKSGLMKKIANNPISSKKNMIDVACKSRILAKTINSGVHVIYIYQSKDNKELSILKIDHCPTK